MEATLPVAALAFAGLVLGAFLAWLVLRARHQAVTAAAVASAEAALQAKVTQAAMRAEQALATSQVKGEELKRLAEELGATRRQLDAARDSLADTRQALGTAQANAANLTGSLDDMRARLAAVTAAGGAAQASLADLQAKFAAAEQALKAERDNAAEKIALLTAAKDELSDRFKAIAGEILESNSKRFAEQHQDSLGQLLNPLRERIVEFQQKVEHVYHEENKDRASLKTEVASLVKMNAQLADQANSLATALRGSNKSQGHWGEMVLERLLEASGLRKGHDYLVQDFQKDAEGRRQYPDVVIQMPEDRALVVDSKVTLVAYERLVSAEDETSRAAALKLHLEAVRAHMKGLSERRYEKLYDRSFDFVVMFMPLEAAFLAAVNGDTTLWQDAWERNILLVSPSTLLFVLRSVANLWTQESRNRNAQEIALRGAELHDKLVLFAGELEQVGERLTQAQASFTEARKRLATGKGNAIRQAQMLVELGVKPARQMPKSLVALSAAEPEPSREHPALSGLTGEETAAALLRADAEVQA